MNGASLPNTIGHTVIRLEEAASTNSIVMETPDYLGNHGLVLLAGHQTAGRGRVGRKWASVPGLHLQFTVVSQIIRSFHCDGIGGGRIGKSVAVLYMILD